MANRKIDISAIKDEIRTVAARSAKAQFVAGENLRAAQERLNKATAKFEVANTAFETAKAANTENQDALKNLGEPEVTFTPAGSTETVPESAENAEGSAEVPAEIPAETEQHTASTVEATTEVASDIAPEFTDAPDEAAKPARTRRGARL